MRAVFFVAMIFLNAAQAATVDDLFDRVNSYAEKCTQDNSYSSLGNSQRMIDEEGLKKDIFSLSPTDYSRLLKRLKIEGRKNPEGYGQFFIILQTSWNARFGEEALQEAIHENKGGFQLSNYSPALLLTAMITLMNSRVGRMWNAIAELSSILGLANSSLRFAKNLPPPAYYLNDFPWAFTNGILIKPSSEILNLATTTADTATAIAVQKILARSVKTLRATNAVLDRAFLKTLEVVARQGVVMGVVGPTTKLALVLALTYATSILTEAALENWIDTEDVASTNDYLFRQIKNSVQFLASDNLKTDQKIFLFKNLYQQVQFVENQQTQKFIDIINIFRSQHPEWNDPTGDQLPELAANNVTSQDFPESYRQHEMLIFNVYFYPGTSASGGLTCQQRVDQYYFLQDAQTMSRDQLRNRYFELSTVTQHELFDDYFRYGWDPNRLAIAYQKAKQNLAAGFGRYVCRSAYIQPTYFWLQFKNYSEKILQELPSEVQESFGELIQSQDQQMKGIAEILATQSQKSAVTSRLGLTIPQTAPF